MAGFSFRCELRRCRRQNFFLNSSDECPTEFGAPIGRIEARFWPDGIALTQIARRLVPVGFRPLAERLPRGAQTLVRAVIDGAHRFERVPLPRFHAADRRHG